MSNTPIDEDVKSAQERGSKADSPVIVPGSFKLISESRDGRLCLFEDGDGHYTVVRSERLA